jgi:hypothetical protein
LDATPGWGLTHDTFDDEQPSPAFETVGIIELKDGESEETTEGITDLRSRVQDSGSEGHSLFLVENRKQEDCLFLLGVLKCLEGSHSHLGRRPLR